MAIDSRFSQKTQQKHIENHGNFRLLEVSLPGPLPGLLLVDPVAGGDEEEVTSSTS